jgi:alpha-methylacyl-CoA racemase
MDRSLMDRSRILHNDDPEETSSTSMQIGKPSGPLRGVKVLEFAGIGPGPFCGMLLSDMGADVLRIDRMKDAGFGLAPADPKYDVMSRGRRSLALDLKQPQSIELTLSLVGKADALIEGFRPGVMERLGLGPKVCLERNPRIIYGRITGWGQDGPLAQAAGHDLNYIALTGALHAIGPQGERPTPPLNLIGDFGGGGAYLAFGIACALYEARASGQGQVIDAAMSEGAASLMAMLYGSLACGQWLDQRGVNTLDGGAPWYDVYETADGKHIAISAIEDHFYAQLLARLDIDPAKLPHQRDRSGWPKLRGAFAAAFKRGSRDEWCERLADSDVCFAPVLSMAEAPQHPHNRARRSFLNLDGVCQPAPAPRFSRTPGRISRHPPRRGEGGSDALAEWGIAAEAIRAVQQNGMDGSLE